MHRSDADVTDATARLIRACGRRLAEADPDDAALLRNLDEALADAWRFAVDGWRAAGISDAAIGRELGVTKQAVAQRWPRRPAEAAA
jgi:hypothetical protein